MTNADFAKRIGVHFSMASRLRSGNRLPSVGTLHRIARELAIPLSDLIAAYELGGDEFSKLLRTKLDTL